MKTSFSEEIVPISIIISTGLLFFGIIFPFSTVEAQVPTRSEIRSEVIDTFRDAPILINIAECESTFRQYSPDGTSLNGGLNNDMVGVMQIYDQVHTDTAASMGYDINTLEGNLGYAKHLYEKNGTSPWLDSAHCWREMPVMDTSSASSISNAATIPHLRYNLALSDRGGDVKLLQQTLNQNNFLVSESGEGSRGHETTYFGEKTQKAVGRFQCEHDIVCASEAGYGQLGPKTRKALNDILKLENKTPASEIIQASVQTPSGVEARLDEASTKVQQLLTRLDGFEELEEKAGKK